jgi:hypothetical protein
MNDVEVQSLLEEAGYRYDVVSGQFCCDLPVEGEVHELQDVSEELEIPLDDLIRWHEEQGHNDELGAD